jgi:hypothetical protein
MSAAQYRIMSFVKLDDRECYDLESLYQLSTFSTTDGMDYKRTWLNNCFYKGHNSSAMPPEPHQPTSMEGSPKSSQTDISFFSLPIELRRIVTDELFTSCRRDLEIHPTITTYREKTTNCYKEDWSKDPLSISVCFPPDFIQLFASKEFFREAIKSFVRFTNIDLHDCDASDVLHGVHMIPALKYILQQVLAQSTQIYIESGCKGRQMHNCDMNMIQSLSLYVDNIKTISIYTDDCFNWVRLPGGMSYIVRNKGLAFLISPYPALYIERSPPIRTVRESCIPEHRRIA